MSSRLRIFIVTAATAMAVAATAVPAAADGVVDPAPIAPGNHFIGEVNTAAANATIRVTCLGPIAIGQTGHPVAGQKVVALPVIPPISSIDGYTGTAANAIEVTIGAASSTATPIILHDWAIPAAIPATLTLPCSGTGAVAFVPIPTSPTARSYTVQVTFVAVP